MLRDSIRNIEYFNDAILYSEDRENQYKVRLSNTNQLNPLAKMGASIGLFGFVLNNLEFSYSKGDAISSYKPNVIKLLKYREMQKFFSDELIEEEQNRRVEWERLSFSNYKKTLTWLAFAVSTGTNQDYFKRFLNWLTTKDSTLYLTVFPSSWVIRIVLSVVKCFTRNPTNYCLTR